MFDVIIIGSGPSGTFAAYQLANFNTLVLDVGNEATPAPRLNKNLHILKQESDSYFEEFIGKQFESLHNIRNEYLMPKLKSPLMRFITSNTQDLSPIETDGFYSVVSLAKGGMANAWGAEVYRFNNEELKDYPITYQDLEKYYDFLTDYIGVSGKSDDLDSYFGKPEGLLPPLKKTQLSQELYSRYLRHRSFFNHRGVQIGDPRLAILSKNHRGRPAFNYENLEFFKSGDRAVFNPADTLNELIQDKKVTYKPKFFVERYEENKEGVIVYARNVEDNSFHTFRGKKLIVALGTINTARFILNSNQDFSTRLPLLDNSISYIPFLNFRKIGSALETKSIGIQLSMTYSDSSSKTPLMGSFYVITGIFRSDLIFNFPLSLRANLLAAKLIFPALTVLQLWYPDYKNSENGISLAREGKLKIQYQKKQLGKVEKHLIATFRKIGYFSLPSLCSYPLPGNSFHYAGTLPMSAQTNQKYGTNPDGLLNGTQHVYIADSSTFPFLPAKNLTFTIMANAMRIADKVKNLL